MISQHDNQALGHFARVSLRILGLLIMGYRETYLVGASTFEGASTLSTGWRRGFDLGGRLILRSSFTSSTRALTLRYWWLIRSVYTEHALGIDSIHRDRNL